MGWGATGGKRMSVIVWDGKTLAADRQATCSDMAARVTKARRLESGEVLAWTGDQEQGLALARWYEAGADRDKWPAFQKGTDWTRLIVADADGVHFYDKEPEQQRLEEPFAAWGSGRDFAIGALAMRANAEKAVEVASMFNVHCGCGCDVFELRPNVK